MTVQNCGNVASHRFTWPGNDESFICQEHVTWVRRVAKAMGLHLQVIELDEHTDKICLQKSELPRPK